MRSTLAKRTKNSTAKLKKKILDSSLQAAGGSIGNFQDHKTSSTIRLILFSRKWFFQGWVHHLCSNNLQCTFLLSNFSPNPTFPRLFIYSNRNPSNNFNMSRAQWWINHTAPLGLVKMHNRHWTWTNSFKVRSTNNSKLLLKSSSNKINNKHKISNWCKTFKFPSPLTSKYSRTFKI